MSPENKGYAISNMPELARAHNNHATPQSCQREQKQTTSTVRVSQRHTATTCEAFHFVSFVPINGRLIEIDGLKEFPIDHGPVDEATPGGWMEEFRQRMLKRLNQRGAEHDIRYNLMAVIPSKYELSSAYLRAMRANQTRLLKIIEILNFSSSFGIFWDHTYSKYMLKETNQVVPVLKKKEEKTDTVGDNATAEKSIEWPTTESLLKCPGQIGLSIDDERISKEANFSLVYNFPERIPQDGVLVRSWVEDLWNFPFADISLCLPIRLTTSPKLSVPALCQKTWTLNLSRRRHCLVHLDPILPPPQHQLRRHQMQVPSSIISLTMTTTLTQLSRCMIVNSSFVSSSQEEEEELGNQLLLW